METPPIRRIDFVATLALASDFAIGQPLEFSLRSCALGVAFCQHLAWSGPETADVFYQALLRYVGCNADTYALSALFGDETQFRREFALVDTARAGEVAMVVFRALRQANRGQPFYRQALNIAGGMLAAKPVSIPILSGHCETAARLAARLGFGSSVLLSLEQLYERWDGKGLPRGLRGEAISPAVRVITLVQDAIVLSEMHGQERALDILAKRRGTVYDPALTDAFLPVALRLLRDGAKVSAMEQVLALFPGEEPALTEKQIDEACLVMADFLDVRAPMFAGHSRAVASLCQAAARSMGLPEPDISLAHRAGLLHDLGEISVPTAVFIKSGRLSDAEQKAIHLHAWHGEQLLQRSPALGRFAAIVGCHHERSNGAGYHRGVKADSLSVVARIVAAAEAYQTKLEDRPHRPRLTPSACAAEMRRMAREGELDPNVVMALLEVAGHASTRNGSIGIAGLTVREIEVLRLIAAGHSTKQIGRQLGIATKTADNHTQNIFSKLGIRTRAAAMLYAIENGLLVD